MLKPPWNVETASGSSQILMNDQINMVASKCLVTHPHSESQTHIAELWSLLGETPIYTAGMAYSVME